MIIRFTIEPVSNQSVWCYDGDVGCVSQGRRPDWEEEDALTGARILLRLLSRRVGVYTV